MKRGKISGKGKAVIAIVVASAVAAGGVFVHFQNRRRTAEAAMQTSSVQSAEVTRNTVQNTVTGTGTLAQSDAENITIPVGITIDKVLVSSGDTVKAGQELASVSKTSINTKISEIQNSISQIDSTLSSLSEDTTDETVTATLSGTITAVYISVGDNVADVMDSEGKLMTLTVDGDNATAMQITATSGKVASLKVSEGSKVSQGDTLFTLTGVKDTSERDELLARRSDLTDLLDEMLQLQKTGTITAPSDGIIQSVNVSDSTEVTGASSYTSSSSTSSGSTGQTGTATSATSAGTAGFMTTAAVQGTSTHDSSASSVSNGFTLMTADVTDTEDETVSSTEDTTSDTSEEDALVLSGLNEENSEDGKAGSDQPSGTADNTDTSDNGSDETGTSDTNTSSDDMGDSHVIQGILNLPIDAPKTGEKAMSLESLARMSTDSRFLVTGLEWNIDANSTFSAGNSYTAYVTLTAGEGYSFSSDQNGVIIKAANANGAVPYTVYDTDGDKSADRLIAVISYTIPEGSSVADANANSSKNQASVSANGSGTQPSADTGAQNAGSASGSLSGSGNGSSGTDISGLYGSAGTSGADGSSVSGQDSGSSAGTSGLAASSAGTSASSSDTAASSEDTGSYETTGFTISSDQTMQVSINVDELDILDIQVGQAVDVTLDAVDGETYSGTVTEISSSGTSSGGSTKYPVTVEISKDDNMLAGMNATATITVSSAQNALTVPSSALTEEGDKTYVYTKNEDGTLSGKTEVTTGLSDGTNTVITDGLSEGDTVYYESAAGKAIENDTTDTEEQDGDQNGFPGGGGNAPSGGGPGENGGGGNMPSGGGPQGG